MRSNRTRQGGGGRTESWPCGRAPAETVRIHERDSGLAGAGRLTARRCCRSTIPPLVSTTMPMRLRSHRTDGPLHVGRDQISRLAVGSREIRPAIQVYRVSEFARQDARMGEDLPFATHGGMAVRHAFPLDGDYQFQDPPCNVTFDGDRSAVSTTSMRSRYAWIARS